MAFRPWLFTLLIVAMTLGPFAIGIAVVTKSIAVAGLVFAFVFVASGLYVRRGTAYIRERVRAREELEGNQSHE